MRLLLLSFLSTLPLPPFAFPFYLFPRFLPVFLHAFLSYSLPSFSTDETPVTLAEIEELNKIYNEVQIQTSATKNGGIDVIFSGDFNADPKNAGPKKAYATLLDHSMYYSPF